MGRVKCGGSAWHTDIGEVRSAITGLPFIVKYGKQQHIDSFVQSGSLRMASYGRIWCTDELSRAACLC